GSVTIAKGKTNAFITVKPIDDALVEGNETVIVTITNRPTYIVGTPSRAVVTITDNDSASTSEADGSLTRTSSTSTNATKPVKASAMTATLIGTWELKVRGADQGSAFVTFHDDHSLSGYGITRNSTGICNISG